jgi:hypothetical protein
MNLRRTMWMAICVVGIFVASRAYAVGEVYTGRVTVIGAETMPSYVGFVLDVGAGACPAGHWLAYRSTQGVDGTKAAYATVFGAWLSGKRITVRVSVNSGCWVDIVRAVN